MVGCDGESVREVGSGEMGAGITVNGELIVEESFRRQYFGAVVDCTLRCLIDATINTRNMAEMQ
jgi:hypothetical protein